MGQSEEEALRARCAALEEALSEARGYATGLYDVSKGDVWAHSSFIASGWRQNRGRLRAILTEKPPTQIVVETEAIPKDLVMVRSGENVVVVRIQPPEKV
jgi:hypothetical protein